MNTTELFLINMGLTYAQITLQTSRSLTPEQKIALENLVMAGAAVSAAFTKVQI